MEMSGEFRIPAARDKVWAALNDPEILQRSVPGCQSITRLSDTEMEGAVMASIGPVKATFKGSVVLSDVNPPHSYTLTGQGKGGPAGFAKGVARVALTEEGGVTVLHYTAEASVGGKLAQIGQRLIDGAARKLSEEFFGNFSTILGGEKSPAEVTAKAKTAPPGLRPIIWIPGLILIMAIMIMLFVL